MKKIITDKEKINEVLCRGVETVYPDRESLEKLLSSGKRIRLYCGYDPSASSLHLGNAISINKLSQFQELGHEVIFLIGDFTGMIGDPTDKLSARKKLSREEVRENSKNYQRQASAFLDFKGDNPAKVMYNSQWSDSISFKELIELSSNFTVQQLIQRDMFQARIEKEKPIYLHEFLYPLAQGYDSVAMDVDLEVGGNDQMFNMLCGRELQKVINKKEKFVLTLKLLADEQGKKMGKTEGNAIFLDMEPEDIYGTVMSWPDGVIIPGFELCTRVPMSEIENYEKELSQDKLNPRDLKMKLAFELTRIFCGWDKAGAAQDNFIRTFQKKELPEEIREIRVKQPVWRLVELLVEVGLAKSKSDARRTIEQGGVKVGNKVAKDIYRQIELTSQGTLLQRGKRNFIKVYFK